MGILQAARQGVLFVRDGNDRNVIGHQAIANQFYPVSLDALLQQIELDAPLILRFEDEALRIAALRNVMGNARSHHTSKSNHGSTSKRTMRREQLYTGRSEPGNVVRVSLTGRLPSVLP